MKISPEAIVAAAFRQLNQFGFAGLSMRSIASSLDVAVGALYYHVPNKQTLLAVLAQQIVAPLLAGDATEAAKAGEAGGTGIGDWASALRTALLQHRDAGELVAAAVAMREVDLFRPLISLGLNPDEAAALVFFVLGHVMDEQANTVFADFGVADATAVADFDTRFAVGLAIFERGLGRAV